MAASPRADYAADTIFALSSGRPPCAIAIVRVSGPAAADAVERLCGRLPEARMATRATLRAGNGETLDHALVLWFPDGRSATGEDVAEFHVHGGVAVVAAVLAALAAIGLRPAEPGEFTRRALLNGRLDYAEAEGLADLLAAETEAQRRDALRRSDGAFGRRVIEWATRLDQIAAQIEAEIDHDVDDELVVRSSFRQDALTFADELDRALRVLPQERLREGVRVAIVGPPNAGKSSLFNALLDEEAAIVADVPGTTRDILERALSIDGVPITLVDTAGIRDTTDAIESEGVRRAMTAAQDADLILDLFPDASQDRMRLVVAAKSDVRQADHGFAISSVTRYGLKALRAEIVKRAKSLLPTGDEFTMSARHRSGIGMAASDLRDAASENHLVIAAEFVRSARSRLDTMVGRADVETMFDALFSRFCLGK